MRNRMILVLAAVGAFAASAQAAVPVSAAKAMRAGLTICNSDLRAGRFQSATDYVRCQLNVESRFAQAAKFDKPELMSNYSSQLLQLAADYDARHISIYTFRARLQQTVQHFTQAVADNHAGGPLPQDYSGYQGQGYQDRTMVIPDATRSQ